MKENKLYKKYAKKLGEFVLILVIVFIVRNIFFPSPQLDEWRSLPPILLQAKSQTDVAAFIEEFKVNEVALEKELNVIGISIEEFKSSVEIGFMLDHPKDKKYGVTFVFRSSIDHELLSPAYTNIVNDFWKRYKLEHNSEE
ncbi:hypothetical protein FLL45_13605 [Aliikangiella marina]|uniref:Uncharacterized protein n=1 Tax=Aliikangiella marina TaxID=1712262 RepID=A0A545T9L2_9GAMM|nr:hypothetical protein [Aliikangiella marina]TQV73895.1 hypothetical protein FLL45_13605 [Aliikangiella marina]